MTASQADAAALAPVAHASARSALRAELLKLRRQRPTWVMVVVGTVLLGLAMLTLAGDPGVNFGQVGQRTASIYQMLSLLQFIFAAGGGVILLTTTSRAVGLEYTLGTIRVILGRGTGRRQLLFAKLSSALLLAAGLLVGYWVLVAIGTVILVLHQTGSLGALTTLPPAVWQNVWTAILACAISACSCVCVGVVVATLARSITGGMVVSVLFFPIDNALALIFSQLHRINAAGPWAYLSGLLLGPSLNRLPALFASGRIDITGALPTPVVHFALGETLLVVAVWLIFLVALGAFSIARRDVLA